MDCTNLRSEPGTVFIGLNFGKLDTTFLKGVGILSILLLMTLSIVSVISIQQFNIVGDLNKTYAETLKQFMLKKMRFRKLQQINIVLCHLLLIAVIILLSKFFSGKDITDSKYFWTFSFSLSYVFLLLYSKWVSKNYNNTLMQTEALLKETEP
jgi:hypothetical protein